MCFNYIQLPQLVVIFAFKPCSANNCARQFAPMWWNRHGMTRTLELTEFIRTEVALEGQRILFLCLVYIICVFVAIRIPVYKDWAQRVGLEAFCQDLSQLHAAHLAPTVSALRERGRDPLRLPCEHGRGVRIWNLAVLAVDSFHGFPTRNKESVNKLLNGSGSKLWYPNGTSK